jgi:hypothetical protein
MPLYDPLEPSESLSVVRRSEGAVALPSCTLRVDIRPASVSRVGVDRIALVKFGNRVDPTVTSRLGLARDWSLLVIRG